MLHDRFIFLQDDFLKTCIIPQQSFKIESKHFFFWRSFAPKANMLYIFPALLFILNRFILNPRHIGTLFRPGIKFAGPQWHTGRLLLAEE